MEDFQSIPSIFKDEVFEKAFEKAEIAKFDQVELDKYEYSLKIYRDLKNVIDTAFDDGKLERTLEIAKALKENGASLEIIIKATGLSENQIGKL